MTDYLIVGLGNPGPQHANQRHNIGFWTLNRLAKRLSVDFKAGRNASTAAGRLADAGVVLVKPRTFVNRSGPAVAELMRRENVDLGHVIVIYDELDLPEGVIRLRSQGGHGGHNGLRSIIAATGSGGFGRIRIGIGRPLDRGVPTWDPEVVMRYVLGRPPKASQEVLDAAVERAADAIEAVIADGWDRAMNKYNTAA
jgi:PTH1 family peptidyl-tRNA hydrolase